MFNVQVKPVFDNGQESVYGETEEITIVGPAGIQGDVIVANEMMENEKIESQIITETSIYPNPNTGDFLNISLNNLQEEVEIVEVRITDGMGRSLMTEAFIVEGSKHEQLMNLNHLAAGTYLVYITMNDTVVTKKLVIMN